MKKIILMFLVLVASTTGCSYKITSSTSQTYQGESENWKADYKAVCSTTFDEKDGKTFVTQREKDSLTITYKYDVKLIKPARHYEVSYSGIRGNHSKQTEDSDTPFVKKEFHSGGGTASTMELSGILKEQENLHKAILIYSGPSYKMRTDAPIKAGIQIDGKSEEIILKPVLDTLPVEEFKTNIAEALEKLWFEKRYPEIAKAHEELEI